jgi:hypothetical protein
MAASRMRWSGLGPAGPRLVGRGAARLAVALGLAGVLAMAPSSHAGEPRTKVPAALELIPLDAQVRVPVPAEMAHERRSLGARADLMTPTAAEALETHAAELAQALGAGARATPQTQKLCGRERRGLRLEVEVGGRARTGWVGAAEVKGRTIVASALWVAGSPNVALLERVAAGILVL